MFVHDVRRERDRDVMPAFPDDSPPTGQNVSVTLSNGVLLTAYYDGAVWWAGLPDNDADVPLDSGHVTAWDYLP